MSGDVSLKEKQILPQIYAYYLYIKKEYNLLIKKTDNFLHIYNESGEVNLTDYGNKIIANGTDYKKQAKIIIEGFLKKKADIDSLIIDGEKDFIKAVKEEIQKIKAKNKKKSFALKIDADLSLSEKQKEIIINNISPFKILNFLNIGFKKKERGWQIGNKIITFFYDKNKKTYIIKDDKDNTYAPVNFYKTLTDVSLIKNFDKLYNFVKRFEELKQKVAMHTQEDWSYILLNMGFKQREKNKYKNRNTGEIVIMYKKDGEYRYFDPKNGGGGNLISFFKNHNIINYEKMLNEINNPKPVDYSPVKLEEKLNLEKLNAEDISKYFAKKIGKITSKRQELYFFKYLFNERKIDKKTVEKYIGEGCLKLSVDYYHNIINSFVLFQNNKFYLCGGQIRGEKLYIYTKNKKIKAQTVKNSIKTLSCIVPDDINASAKNEKVKIVIGESYIDCLSFIELKNMNKTIILDTVGVLTNKAKIQLELIFKAYKKNIEKVYLIFDNDKAGEKYTKEVEEILKKAGISYEKPEIFSNCKDWNEVLKQKKDIKTTEKDMQCQKNKKKI